MTTSVSIPDSRRANKPPWYRSLFLQLIVADAVAAKTGSGELPHTVEFLLNIIPVSIVSAFAENALLQVLFFAVLFGLALAKAGESGPPIVFELVDRLSHLFFTIIGWIMRFAPLGALGAMAYIVGQYGIASLGSYAKLIAACYIGATLFILILAAIVRYFAGVNLWKFVKYIKDELFLALGTASTEVVLPRIMVKLTNAGCSRTTTGLVVPWRGFPDHRSLHCPPPWRQSDTARFPLPPLPFCWAPTASWTRCECR
jgi:aerobic C4-dicarboxylate transport protein